LFSLYEGATALPATAADVENYAGYIGDPDFPILADGEGLLRDSTPMTQENNPELCILTPDMTIGLCTSGHGKLEEMLDNIRAHAGL
jgi:hypothetical protein